MTEKAPTLRLTLLVTYDLNGEELADLKYLLEQLVPRAMGEGLVTGYTDAEVLGYTVKVEEL